MAAKLCHIPLAHSWLFVDIYLYLLISIDFIYFGPPLIFVDMCLFLEIFVDAWASQGIPGPPQIQEGWQLLRRHATAYPAHRRFIAQGPFGRPMAAQGGSRGFQAPPG